MSHIINLGSRTRTQRPRPEELEPWQPGRPAKRILELLGEYRYLTTDLLAWIYEQQRTRGLYTVRNTLTKLYRHGYVERFFRPTDAGSRQLVYTLSLKGAEQIYDPVEYREERAKVSSRARPKADYEHALAVSVLHVLWNLGAPLQSDLVRLVDIWQDKEGTAGKTRNHFEAKVGRQTVSVEPDLTVLVANLRRNHFRPVFFEVERTHKNIPRRRRRFLAYGDLLSKAGQGRVSSVFQAEMGITPEPAMVVFVCENQDVAERYRLLARTVLKANTHLYFSSLERLLELQPQRRRDGSIKTQAVGVGEEKRDKQLVREVPLLPHDFFAKPLLTAMSGEATSLIERFS